ncbi:hypothetical protein COCNU_02G009010 [Cocos nucifera]|uniref:Uncharacterized protein n=1 Tax=Cocos nucifera TaxID=13894 RepID=A0A8K0MX05_COCNU|nr:hypothetical protein COCNU_02G009010 [Cocos nucifera]
MVEGENDAQGSGIAVEGLLDEKEKGLWLWKGIKTSEGFLAKSGYFSSSYNCQFGGHFLFIIIELATNNKAEVTEAKKDAEVIKAEASNHKAKVEHFKEVLREVEKTLMEAKEELAMSKSALEKASPIWLKEGEEEGYRV